VQAPARRLEVLSYQYACGTHDPPCCRLLLLQTAFSCCSWDLPFASGDTFKFDFAVTGSSAVAARSWVGGAAGCEPGRGVPRAGAVAAAAAAAMCSSSRSCAACKGEAIDMFAAWQSFAAEPVRRPLGSTVPWVCSVAHASVRIRLRPPHDHSILLYSAIISSSHVPWPASGPRAHTKSSPPPSPRHARKTP
jgi:hypothetical protein